MAQAASKPTLRDNLSAIIGQRLPQAPSLWIQTFQELDKHGRIQQRELLLIVVALAEKLAEYESYE